LIGSPVSDGGAVENFRLCAGRIDPPLLQADEIHVWSVRLPAIGLDELKQTLSADELERASHFHFDVHRRSFISRRAILRILLAGYLEATPDALEFSYNEFGKPRLAAPVREPAISFNLSHSGELLRIAIGLDRELGIDVERIDESAAIESVAQNFFSGAEVAALESLPPTRRRAAFFSCWTRKEAYIKARGMGLSIPLESFDVSVEPGGAATFVAEDRSAKVWKVENIESNHDYSVSVAAEGSAWKVVCRTLHREAQR
jgi:4'-phosphopantetheinyl transferase